MNDLGIIIDRSSDVPAYRQIYLQISAQIRDGAIGAGAFLPKILELSKALGIARNTVEAAYKQLSLEGYAQGFRGRGYIVEDLNLSPLSIGGISQHAHPVNEAPPTFPGRNPLGDDFGCRYDFSYGNRAPDDFPMRLWRQHADKVMTSDYGRVASSYMDPLGLPALRQQLASYLGATRNVSCTPEQVALLPGTQMALQAICALFTPAERIVGMEEPGYDVATKVFKDNGWDIVPVPAGRSGRSYMGSLVRGGVKCLFSTPSNQFPLGHTLPISTRLELIGWAKRTQSFIIEDDYCCEYRYDGSSPIPSLQSLDPSHVIYLGTLSKILSPAVRIAFAVLPEELLGRWKQVHARDYCSVDWLSQAVMESMMASGDWNKHVHNTVAEYHRKHAVLMEAIEREMGDRVQLLGVDAGLHLLMGDGEGRHQCELIKLARRNDVRVYETQSYWSRKHHPMENFVLVGFSAIDVSDVEPGIKALADAWYG